MVANQSGQNLHEEFEMLVGEHNMVLQATFGLELLRLSLLIKKSRLSSQVVQLLIWCG
jgi:hypothetical protein